MRPPVTKTKCLWRFTQCVFLMFFLFFCWQMAHMSHVNKQYFFEERGPHWNGYSRALMEAFKIFQSFKISHFYLGSIEGMVSMMFKAPKPEVKMCRLSQMHFLDRVGFLFFWWMSLNHLECFWSMMNIWMLWMCWFLLIFVEYFGLFHTLDWCEFVQRLAWLSMAIVWGNGSELMWVKQA